MLAPFAARFPPAMLEFVPRFPENDRLLNAGMPMGRPLPLYPPFVRALMLGLIERPHGAPERKPFEGAPPRKPPP